MRMQDCKSELHNLLLEDVSPFHFSSSNSRLDWDFSD
jgi:hypothetical protein